MRITILKYALDSHSEHPPGRPFGKINCISPAGLAGQADKRTGSEGI